MGNENSSLHGYENGNSNSNNNEPFYDHGIDQQNQDQLSDINQSYISTNGGGGGIAINNSTTGKATKTNGIVEQPSTSSLPSSSTSSEQLQQNQRGAKMKAFLKSKASGLTNHNNNSVDGVAATTPNNHNNGFHGNNMNGMNMNSMNSMSNINMNMNTAHKQIIQKAKEQKQKLQQKFQRQSHRLQQQQQQQHHDGMYSNNGTISQQHPHSRQGNMWWQQQQQNQQQQQQNQQQLPQPPPNNHLQNTYSGKKQYKRNHNEQQFNFMFASADGNHGKMDPYQQHHYQNQQHPFYHQQQQQQQQQQLNQPSLHHHQQKQQQQLNIKSNQSDETEWENAWEEDNESDDENDDDDDNDNDANNNNDSLGPAIQGKPGTNTSSYNNSKSNHHHNGVANQILRPTMDGAHSSSIATTMNSSIHSNTYMEQQQQQQQQQRNNYSSSNVANANTPMRKGGQSSNSKKFGNVIENGENGVKWDKESYEKPNITMFLPILRVLGKGSFGKVVLVQKRSGQERGGLFAMKMLRKTHLLKRGQIERTRTERRVLAKVNHPFIMKLHFAFQSDEKLFLVLDYCAGGELFFHLSRHRRFSEETTRFYAAELLLALGHLHSHGIIYRDLKPENVLLDSDGHVKLGDFGLAKTGIQHPYKGASSLCGTPEYMAPEILQQMGHGFCVDYWGLGMLTYEMMTGLPPWYTTEDRAILYRRLKSAPLDIPSYFSPAVSSICFNLLQRDPRRRLGVRGMKTVMNHEFFIDMNFRHLIYKSIEAPIRPCEGWKATPDQRRQEKPSSTVPNDLDVATANFDKQFTRMAVNSLPDQEEQGYSSDELEGEDLNENTFIGFTYDEDSTSNSKHKK